MNTDEMSWLLRTIEEPETAKRFAQAQYERGRISYQVIADLARDHGWTEYPALQGLTATAISMDYVTA
jgi:LPS sulfotransferase NodH